MQWRDAQIEIPENLQICVVIGEAKTTGVISPYVAMYMADDDTFQSMATHKIFIPRKRARWWCIIDLPVGVHRMDVFAFNL
jgi:hypothetical protein